VGFGEGYMEGEWDTPDLSELLQAMSLNFDRLQTLVDGQPFMRLINSLKHLGRRNTRAGSKRNIHAHYDLGEDFYGAWLDPSMTYSSAVFSSPSASLQAAQEAKYGCGWGGFAEHAAGQVGARVTAITISQAQYQYAKKRIFERGLADRAEILLTDYRDVRGRFDRVASIEMFEAVGEAYWPTYFGKVADLLKPGGQAGLQIITIADQLFEGYRSRPDFIQRYIFPGGMLPSEPRLQTETDAAGLQWTGVRRFADDYARTLHEWAEMFAHRWSDIRGLGFDERFKRLWLYYLGYCEAGFRTGRTDVIQLALSKG
jgi:cyclopropane-fatty-acyl-phospholipid synthase